MLADATGCGSSLHCVTGALGESSRGHRRQVPRRGVAAPREAPPGAHRGDPAGRYSRLLPTRERARPQARGRCDLPGRARARSEPPSPPPRRRIDLRSERVVIESHEHEHDTGHAHGPGTAIGTAGASAGFLHEIFVPHSHDAADSVDDALEASAEGIRALKISLVVLRRHRAVQLARRLDQRLGRAARRHDPQLLRRADRGAAVDRLRARPARRRPAATPTATAGPRTSPGCSSSR